MSVGLSCSADPILPQVEIRGDRAEVGGDVEEFCPTTVTYLDEFVTRLESVLGVVGAPHHRVYVFEDPDRVQYWCGGGERGGCYQPPPMEATFLEAGRWEQVFHELVHSVLITSRVGRVDRFMEEAVAEAFGAGDCSEPVQDIDVAALIGLPAGSAFTTREYSAGAGFVRWLLADSGDAQLVEFLTCTEPGVSAQEVERCFATAYLRSLESAVTDFRAESLTPWGSPEYCLEPDSIPAEDTLAWEIQGAFECGDLGEFGPNHALRGWRVTNFAGGNSQIVADLSSGVSGRLLSCNCQVPGLELTGSQEAELPTGTLALELAGPGDPEATVSIRIEVVP